MEPTRIDVTGQVRMIRETKGMTQQQLADAAGVSLSTVRRLERDGAATFNATTERHLERVLGLRQGGLQILREGERIERAWRKPSVIALEHYFRYPRAPLSDVRWTGSYFAGVFARGLHEMLGYREEELSLLAAGKLWVGGGIEEAPKRLFEWLPWPAQMLATPTWLDRMFDSCEQVATVLESGEVPLPLRLAEAVILRIAADRAWILNTNSFFDQGEEITEDSWPAEDELFEVADSRPLFARGDLCDWVPESSPWHPYRWWQSAERREQILA